MPMTFTLEWVFLFSQCFPSDSTPQTSLGEGRWPTIFQETGTDYQLKREQQTDRLLQRFTSFICMEYCALIFLTKI